MDRIEEYRQIIRRVLGEHLEHRPSEDGIDMCVICDDISGNYLFLEIGWQKQARIYSTVFHLRLNDNKIWVEQDWTEQGVANELLSAGIPPEDIELGFQPPEMRPYTELAEMVAARKVLREREEKQ